ncbi:MAG: EutN/CcmL family microcompartment protein [candidate division Zixibacteria bacterium]|nr:EutN/CcmL family microcompartment protein [candidate division Zixibacteria bacterium]
MKLGKVCGTVVSTVKDQALEGLRLRLLYPAAGEGTWSARPIVAVDTIGAREDDIVIWISAREATLALTDRVIPTDAAIVGIVDEQSP